MFAPTAFTCFLESGVGANDFLYELVPHDIALVKVDELQPGNPPQNFLYLNQPRDLMARQVHLRDVTRNYDL